MGVLKKTVKEASEEALKIKADLDQETADVLGDMAKTQTAELEATKLQVEQTKKEAAKIIADVKSGQASAVAKLTEKKKEAEAAIASADAEVKEAKDKAAKASEAGDAKAATVKADAVAKSDADAAEAIKAIKAKADADTSKAVADAQKGAKDEMKSAFAPITQDATFDQLVEFHALLSNQATKLVETIEKQESSAKKVKAAIEA